MVASTISIQNIIHNVNNKEFINELAQRCGYSQDNTQRLVKSVVEAMALQFDDGESVQVPDFGVFELKKRQERIVVNPSTGRKMLVPPKIVLAFKPSAVVKKKMNGGEDANG